MNQVGATEMEESMNRMKKIVAEHADGEIPLKPLMMQTCANLFLLYMCSLRFDYEDKEFVNIVHLFDKIFWEINQGYAVDFLPWLSPFYKGHMHNLESWSKTIRHFILKRVISTRSEKLHQQKEEDDDFLDALLRSLSKEEDVSQDTIIFMLEDFVGGHSAIGNSFILNLLFFIVN
jgi:cytochrome P450 family 307 subfamily A